MRTSERILVPLVTVLHRLSSLGLVALAVAAVILSHLLSRGERRASRLSFGAIVLASILLSPRLWSLLPDGSLPGGDPTDYLYYERQERGSNPRTFRFVPIGRRLKYESGIWTDDRGRVVRFRGANLPAKTPHFPRQLRDTAESENFYETKRTVTFVSRPLVLEEASLHFRRLAHFGYNLVRLTATWEAVMHEGPGVLDTKYLAYLSDLVDVAAEHGIYVLIDPHQDVWSRFTGGDGAPWWTLDAAGFVTDDDSMHAAGCAVLHQHHPKGEGLPKMLWPTNYGRLATATMFTLFFAGDDFAPGVKAAPIDGAGEAGDVSVQSFLQDQYFMFVDAVADALKDKPNVLGFGTMNEPSNGFVGLDDLRHSPLPVPLYHSMSAFDSMKLGSGEAVDVPYFSAPFVHNSTATMNPSGRSCWSAPTQDVWRAVGVYDVDPGTGERRLLRPHHFRFDGDFLETYLLPFYRRFRETVDRHNPRFVVYAEPHIDVTNPSVPPAPAGLDPNGFGWAPHWYDAATLFAKSYSHWVALDVDLKMPVVTPTLIDWAFERNLRHLRESGRMGGADGDASLHVLLGETGVPFDLAEDDSVDGGDASRSGPASTIGGRRHSSAIAALDRTLRAAEAADLDYTLWNYQYDSAGTGKGGDLWNGEDLSIAVLGRKRGLRAAVRPYVRVLRRSVGEVGVTVVSQRHDIRTLRYELLLASPAATTAADPPSSPSDGDSARDEEQHLVSMVELYVPAIHYTEPKFVVSSGAVEFDEAFQRAIWRDIDFSQEAMQTFVLIEGNKGDKIRKGEL